MKVISGLLKGKKIIGFDIDGTRPTMDRIKESIFGSIQNYIDNAIVLDLFAGSGNLGIEAISNGSSICYFNDKNKKSIDTIKQNIQNLNIESNSVVMQYDYLECLNILVKKSIKFDIVFLDPPYNNEILNDIITTLLEKNILNPNGIIICEISKMYLGEYSELVKIKEKRYGEKYVIIYKIKG